MTNLEEKENRPKAVKLRDKNLSYRPFHSSAIRAPFCRLQCLIVTGVGRGTLEIATENSVDNHLGKSPFVFLQEYYNRKKVKCQVLFWELTET